MLPPNATVREACQRMRDRRVGAVLVTDGDRRLAGIFTARDAVHRVLAEGRNAAHTALAEVMTPDPDTIPAGKMAIEALRLMEDGRYRHLPIVDEGKVVRTNSAAAAGICSERAYSSTAVSSSSGRSPATFSRISSALYLPARSAAKSTALREGGEPSTPTRIRSMAMLPHREPFGSFSSLGSGRD